MKHKLLDLSTNIKVNKVIVRLISTLATVKSLKADGLSVSPSSERIKELWIALGLYGEWWSYAIGRNMAT